MRIHPVVAQTLRRGDVGILPTDTIYGIVGSALNKKTVLRIYKHRKRNPKKPMIILIGDMRYATWKKFGIELPTAHRALLARLWPDAVSVILPCTAKKFAYLHRGTKTLAFRMPKPKWLRELLKKTGPLVAPSANWEGKLPAKTIREAEKYFSDRIDFYVDAGRLTGKPSTLVRITPAGEVLVLRKGAIRIP
jgi:L-threonylcarbamoyladenylate synthase